MKQIQIVLSEAGFSSSHNATLELKGEAKEMADQCRKSVLDIAGDKLVVAISAPDWIDRGTLDKTGYLANYPEQLIEREQNSFYNPSACFHLYPSLRGSFIDEGMYFIEARCMRKENEEWKLPFRLKGFNMIELVGFYSERKMDREIAQIENTVRELLKGFGLNFKEVFASDSFFFGDRLGAKVIQKLKGLKREYICSVGGEEIAVASLNKHEDFFGKRFDINTSKGSPVHSFCLAFGLERLVAAIIVGNKEA